MSLDLELHVFLPLSEERFDLGLDSSGVKWALQCKIETRLKSLLLDFLGDEVRKSHNDRQEVLKGDLS